MRLVTPAVVFLAGVLVTTTSCGDDDEEAEATPRRSTTTERESTTTTLDPVEAEKQAVIAARQAAELARAESAAAPSPDPENAALHATHTGAMLEQWVDTTTILQFNGFAIRYPEHSQARSEVESVNFEVVDGQDVAYLEVCSVEDSERFSTVTGEVLDPGVPRTIHATEAMKKEGGTWKLAERRENSYWEGVAGCAVD